MTRHLRPLQQVFQRRAVSRNVSLVPDLPNTDTCPHVPNPAAQDPGLQSDTDQEEEEIDLVALPLVLGEDPDLIPGLGIRGDREANLVVAPPVDGGREGQRTEVVEGPVHRVVLQLEGDGLIPEAGPGLILGTGGGATDLVPVPETGIYTVPDGS